MDVLYFAFSNSQINSLPHLQMEYQRVNEILSPRAYRQDYFLKMEPFADIKQVCRSISLHRENLYLFHYSGHADRDVLLLQEELARGEGLANLLGSCPQLKLVFLNGCCTYGMVDALLNAGITTIVATSARVDDSTAADFSLDFYTALEHGESIDQAFELAKGTLQTAHDIMIHRGIYLEAGDRGQASWGLFFNPEQEEIVKQTTLRSRNIVVQDANFDPNKELLSTLYDTLGGIHPKISDLKARESQGEYVELGDKQKDILNVLPIPISEHLRKLLCPVDSENEGFDRISKRRLEQITTVYQMTMELLTFTLISQIWEVLLHAEEPELLDIGEIQDSLSSFFSISRHDRRSFDYFPLIRQLLNYLDNHKVDCFVEELGLLAVQFTEKEEFNSACGYLNFVRRQVNENLIANSNINELCRRAEHNLSVFLSQLGFLAKYTLISVKDIDIRKYRHQKQATYNHALLKLMRVMGKIEVTQYVLDNFLDNRAVMLVKDEGMQFDIRAREFRGEELSFLSLSPFVIDENAFIENTDISKLYFFTDMDIGNRRYSYKYVKKPDDNTVLEVSESSKFDAVWEQFEAFRVQALGVHPLNDI